MSGGLATGVVRWTGVAVLDRVAAGVAARGDGARFLRVVARFFGTNGVVGTGAVTVCERSVVLVGNKTGLAT